jgi:hypothetical protein
MVEDLGVGDVDFVVAGDVTTIFAGADEAGKRRGVAKSKSKSKINRRFLLSRCARASE